MTPDTPSPPPDGPLLPPRHRPTLENITKDTTELDLWAFEDDLDLTEPPPPETKARAASSWGSGGELPAPRERHVMKPREMTQPLEKTSPADGERIQMNVGKARERTRPSVEIVSVLQPESEFDELENWDDLPAQTQGEDFVDAVPPQVAAPKPVLEPEPKAQPKIAAAITEQKPVAATKETRANNENEFAPVTGGNAKAASLRPRLQLTHLERIGLLLLLVLLAVGGMATFVYSINRLPTESARAGAADFPIKGSSLTIESAASYWREPITDGSAPEIIRRGTKLLPVLELKVSQGSGVVRVLFRNEERAVEGDAVTRTAHGPGMLVIPATAGFDDIGMHAAYRTGGTKPWTVEIYEAPSENASGKEFTKLFETHISTDRR